MTNKNCGIYKITNTVTGKFYIGSAVNIKKRWAEHRSRLGANKHGNRHLQNSWNKHGEDSFTFEVLEYCKKERLIEREQFYIDNEKPAYNISPTAGNRLGVKNTDETKRKMSKAHKSLWAEEYKLKHRPTEEHLHKMHEANKGRHHTEEAKLKMSEAQHKRHKDHPATEETKRKMSEARKGKPLSEETRRKQSEALKGRKLSEEQILQIIACNTGRKHTEEARKHMSEAHIGKPSNWRGRHHTEETRRKLSEALKGRHHTEETKRKLSEAQKGHPNYNLEPPSEETKHKISESLKRYWAERKANE